MTVKDIRSLIPAAIVRFKKRIPRSAEWIDTIPIKVQGDGLAMQQQASQPCTLFHAKPAQ